MSSEIPNEKVLLINAIKHLEQHLVLYKYADMIKNQVESTLYIDYELARRIAEKPEASDRTKMVSRTIRDSLRELLSPGPEEVAKAMRQLPLVEKSEKWSAVLEDRIWTLLCVLEDGIDPDMGESVPAARASTGAGTGARAAFN